MGNEYILMAGTTAGVQRSVNLVSDTQLPHSSFHPAKLFNIQPRPDGKEEQSSPRCVYLKIELRAFSGRVGKERTFSSTVGEFSLQNIPIWDELD